MEVAVADEVLRVHAAGRARFSLMQDAPETVVIGTSELVADPGSGMTDARNGRRREPVAAAGPAPDHRPPRPLARGAREHDRGVPPGDRARRRDDRGRCQHQPRRTARDDPRLDARPNDRWSRAGERRDLERAGRAGRRSMVRGGLRGSAHPDDRGHHRACTGRRHLDVLRSQGRRPRPKRNGSRTPWSGYWWPETPSVSRPCPATTTVCSRSRNGMPRSSCWHPNDCPTTCPLDPPIAIGQARALDAPIIQNHHRFLTRELVAALHEAGIAVWSWTTNDGRRRSSAASPRAPTASWAMTCGGSSTSSIGSQDASRAIETPRTIR